MDPDHPAPQPDIEGAIALLQSPDMQIRQFMAYLLGQAGSEKAVEPLIALLEDENVGVRGAAANALGKIGDRRALPHLEKLLLHDNRQVVVWAAFAMTCLGEDYFHVLINALRSDDVHIRRSGILALNQLGDKRAIPPLLALRNDLEKRFDGDNTVAEAVARTLTELGYAE